MKNLFLIVTAAGALLAADIAAAQTPPPPPAPPGGYGQGAGQGYGPPPGGGPGGFGQGGPGRFGRGGRGGFRRHRPTAEEIQKRNADLFAQLDANHDGKVTLQEFHADLERRKLEREKAMFDRFSGGQDSFTLDQLNARATARLNQGGPGGPGGPGRGPGRGAGGPGPGPGGAPPAR